MKKIYKVLIGVTILLITIRLILPYGVLYYANKTQANMKGYFGHIEDIDLSIYRGAYTINDIYLNKIGKVALPSTVKANASVYEGTLTFDIKLNALNIQPTFDLNAELKNTNLVLLNDFLKVYGNFDVHRNVSYCFQNTCNKFRLKMSNMITSIYYQNKQI